MPSIARIVGLALLISAPTFVVAEDYSPSESPPGQREFPIAPLPSSANAETGTIAPAAHQEEPSPGRLSSSPRPIKPEAVEQAASLPKPAPHLLAAAPAAPPPAAASAPAGRRDSPVPLGAAVHSARGEHARPASNLPTLATIGGSLAVVLALFFVFAWAMRRTAPRGSVLLPGEVFEVLGRAPLAARQQVHLLRCGTKLLLVSVTPAGTETLTEVTDPLEVDRLSGLCRQAHPQSATAAFRQVFQQIAPKRPGRGLLDREPEAIETRRARRWEDEDA